jgi:hypothetical protein
MPLIVLLRGYSMKTYIIKKVCMNKMNEELWRDIPSLLIDNYPWDINKYRPNTEVKLAYSDSKLMVKFIIAEKNPKAEYENINEPVYKDSCVEFFFNPAPEKSDEYINFEMNSKGNLLLQIGKNKEDRQFINGIDINMFNIISYIGNKFWTLEFSIPIYFIEKYYKDITFYSGYKISGNFYKCGDETLYPHYGCWNEIDSKAPNFHLPQFFGELILE